MADVRHVCCMCGDIGFSDKLFQCLRCLYRFQHSYCSNYYREESSTEQTAGLCDWCRSEEHRADGRGGWPPQVIKQASRVAIVLTVAGAQAEDGAPVSVRRRPPPPPPPPPNSPVGGISFSRTYCANPPHSGKNITYV
ncbi:uncharacterized protein LOC110017901 [Phalaenopsis equestris]|uniref:uncharacterized protein LOC110017901 n=1 Tax=Phalaenopsis equestris TaxID=78828 RepID=UPI0009E63CAA|nr:uncharacterized protein LOC110017901 [Phalaenopsis equestris]